LHLPLGFDTVAESAPALTHRHHILFTSTFFSSFIDNDLRLLRRKFDVTAITAHGVRTILRYRQVVKTVDVTFSWFASVHSSILIFLARRNDKKSILVLGGGDVAKERTYNYGAWNSWWRSIFVRYAIMHASAVLCVDEFLKTEAIRLARYPGNNILTIPTGFDEKYFVPDGNKEQIVLTVGACPDMARIKKKGIDLLFAVARELKEVRFVVVGIAEGVARQLVIPANVEIHPFVSREDLLRFYQRSKIYCQPSRHEGLPSALCEAMLCECIPVGTKVAGIPNAIGDTGFLVDSDNVPQLCSAISAAHAASPETGRKARKRIQENFSLARRSDELLRIIEQLTK
jgi:glycosyltransferase involved in cell wall biosynthesis